MKNILLVLLLIGGTLASVVTKSPLMAQSHTEYWTSIFYIHADSKN